MLSNRFWRFLAILVVLAGPVNSGFAAEGFPSLDIPLQLTVDTVVDSNEPALQACVLSVPGDCSLRGAISRANAFPGLAVNISLPGGLYVLDLSGSDDANQSGDLDLAGQVSLSGAGRETTVISANRLDRVLDIQPGAVAALSDLTLRDGLAGPDESGGGVRNRGTLELARLAITANQAGDARLAAPPANPARTGGSGGGIFNSGSLSLHDSLVTENAGGRGADLPKPANYASCAAGAGGSGGGIYNAGWLEITNSRVVQNQAGAGGNGPACIWFCDYPGGNVYPGGTGGAGGGVYNAGTLLGSALLVQQNQAGLGGDGGFDLVWSSPGGAGGNGGGVFNSGWLQVSNSRLEDNVGGEGGLSGLV